MSSRDTTQNAAKHAGSGISRVRRAWRALPPERQLAAAAAAGLCLTLFLPWYQETGFASGKKLQTTSASLTGWHAFSWVEAAVLLVAVSATNPYVAVFVLALCSLLFWGMCRNLERNFSAIGMKAGHDLAVNTTSKYAGMAHDGAGIV